MKNGDKHGRKLRILCADDNVHVAYLLGATLRMQGYEVATAFDGAEALAILTKEPGHYDLLITDVRMPRLDGYALAKQARDAGYAGKIIVFASPLENEEKKRFRELSVAGIIEKPTRQKELLAMVRSIQIELWPQKNARGAA